MAKSKFEGLDQIDGNFTIKGIVTGVGKPNFYQEKTDKNGNPFRSINFGVQVSKDSVLYLGLNGMTQENVYFYSKDKKETSKQPWNSRNTFKREGYRLIGVNLGLEKTTTDKGEVNDKKLMVPFDASKYISENLKDGMSVFVRGKLDHSSYKNQAGELQRNVKLIPNQISLCQEVNFDEEDFVPTADFTQPFIFIGSENIVQEGTGEITGLEVTGTIVNYNSIETTTFRINEPSLGKNFKKLKEYNYIKAWGTIETERNTETVEAEDVWGEVNKMEAVRSPYLRVFVITGADPKSIDNEKYSESKMEKAMREMKKAEAEKSEFKSQTTSSDGEWGNPVAEEDDDETGW